MEQAKTYTKRENACLTGVAAWVPAERVEITAHKSARELLEFGRDNQEGCMAIGGRVSRNSFALSISEEPNFSCIQVPGVSLENSRR